MQHGGGSSGGSSRSNSTGAEDKSSSQQPPPGHCRCHLMRMGRSGFAVGTNPIRMHRYIGTLVAPACRLRDVRRAQLQAGGGGCSSQPRVGPQPQTTQNACLRSVFWALSRHRCSPFRPPPVGMEHPEGVPEAVAAACARCCYCHAAAAAATVALAAAQPPQPQPVVWFGMGVCAHTRGAAGCAAERHCRDAWLRQRPIADDEWARTNPHHARGEEKLHAVVPYFSAPPPSPPGPFVPLATPQPPLPPGAAPACRAAPRRRRRGRHCPAGAGRC